MTVRRALALTTKQLAQVRQAASLLPPLWREAFAQAVARRLVGVTVVGDDDVAAAIISVLGGLGISTPVQQEGTGTHDDTGKVSSVS